MVVDIIMLSVWNIRPSNYNIKVNDTGPAALKNNQQA